MITEPGAYKIPAEEYHLDPVVVPSLSRGVIMDILFRSPLHARANHPRLNLDCKPMVDKKFDPGTVAHGLFLEGIDKACIIDPKDHVGKKGGIPTGWTNDSIREARDEARAIGKTPLLPDQYGIVTDMVKAANIALSKSELAGIFDDGDPEMTYVWEEGPVFCRALVDKISKDRKFILDYKTTGTSANPEDFIRQILSHGYDVQSVFYSRGVEVVEKIKPNFVFLVQENEPPYPCSFIGLSPEFQAMAEQKVIRGLDLWGNCMAKGEWPGYPPRICWIDPPAWALGWEMRATFLGSSMEDI
jgi:hypothetical protein